MIIDAGRQDEKKKTIGGNRRRTTATMLEQAMLPRPADPWSLRLNGDTLLREDSGNRAGPPHE